MPIRALSRNSLPGADMLVTIHTSLSVLAMVLGATFIRELLRVPAPQLMSGTYILIALFASLTGFLLPAQRILPSHILGVLSCIALATALYSRAFRDYQSGSWRVTYRVASVISVYFLFFVAVAQGFTKIPSLHEAAPTLSEPPFAAAQGVVLVVFAYLGYRCIKSNPEDTSVSRRALSRR